MMLMLAALIKNLRNFNDFLRKRKSRQYIAFHVFIYNFELIKNYR